MATYFCGHGIGRSIAVTGELFCGAKLSYRSLHAAEIAVPRIISRLYGMLAMELIGT